MKGALVLAAALACRAFAGPVGAGDPHSVSATGFPGAYLASFDLALADDARFGSRLLDALDTHLQAVGVMTGRREVVDYLEQSAGGSEGVQSLRGTLGREALDPVKASALLLAEALVRPAQFREVIEGLEARRTGVGRQAVKLLSRKGTHGTGDKELFAALRAAAKHRPGEPEDVYAPGGRLAELFGLESSLGRDGIGLEEPSRDGEVRDAGRGRAAEPAGPAR